jgi:hypothetical protein
VVASTDKNYLAGILAVQDDGVSAGLKDQVGHRIPISPSGNPIKAVASTLLTTWRRLWVEVDDMGPVAGNNGDAATDDFLQNGQEVGPPNTARLSGEPPVGMPPIALAEAYIKPFVNKPGVGTPDHDFPFQLNVEVENGPDDVPDLISDQYWQSRPFNEPDFWVAYLLGGFQGPEQEDNDPEGEASVRGYTYPRGGSVVFIEATRDRSVDFGEDVVLREQNVVLHEIGHAVADSGDEPVTRNDEAEPGRSVVLRYTEPYLEKLRANSKPRDGR